MRNIQKLRSRIGEFSNGKIFIYINVFYWFLWFRSFPPSVKWVNQRLLLKVIFLIQVCDGFGYFKIVSDDVSNLCSVRVNKLCKRNMKISWTWSTNSSQTLRKERKRVRSRKLISGIYNRSGFSPFLLLTFFSSHTSCQQLFLFFCLYFWFFL